MAAKIRLFAVFCDFLCTNHVRRLSGCDGHILTLTLAFVSALQTTQRTANMCSNILTFFAPPDDRGDRTNQLY